MKIFLFLTTIFSFLSLTADGFQKAAIVEKNARVSIAENKTSEKNKTPVLVELFTSEGCPTCPPADRNLAILENEQSHPDAEIVTLALHVDYWNRADWADPFSSPMFSQRQEIYNDKFKLPNIYTPQMVVDGARQFAGGNLSDAQKAIGEAAKVPKASVELSGEGDKLNVKISDVPKHENAAVFLAVAENNLSTGDRRGEIGAPSATRVSVVRALKPLGRVTARENSFEIETVLEVEPNWKKNNLKAVVFVQENQSRKILGVGWRAATVQ